MVSKIKSSSYLHTQESALKYICKEKWGYIDGLKEQIGEEMFERFKSVGIIECGNSPREDTAFCGTWKKTKTADREVTLYDSPSLRERIRYIVLGF
jgi:hypothetical protein